MPTTKTVSLPDDQVKWIERNHISLSKFLQAKIEEEMENDKES